MAENSMKFISVQLRKAPLATVGNYFQRLVVILKAKPTVTEIVDDSEFRSLVLQLQTAMVAKQGFSQTERLETADKKRDTILTAVGYLMRGYATMPTEYQDDAKALLSVLRDFGIAKMRTAPYGAETSYIRSLIERINTPPNMEKQKKFPVFTDWMSILEEANDEFVAIMNEKAGELKLDFESCTEIRLKLIPVYQQLTAMIQAHAMVGTAPEFAQVIAEANAQIIAYHLD